MLRDKLSKIVYTDELSSRVYYMDANMEKQIIDLLMNLCKNGNDFMQDYMKKQHNNSRSFNMVFGINEFTKTFNDHLHYPVAYDTFISCLKCLNEFIQGPNKANQNVLIANDFVGLANGILIMKFHDNDQKRKKMKTIDEEIKNEFSKYVEYRSHDEEDSFSIGKVFSKKFVEIQFFTQPASNYMISLAKYQVLLLLNNLLEGFEPNDYIYYLYRREIEPSAFRKNFAYQQYFFN